MVVANRMFVDPSSDFREALVGHGLQTDDPVIGDGKLHRFTVNGHKPKSNKGWYVLFCDSKPAGIAGDWSTGTGDPLLKWTG